MSEAPKYAKGLEGVIANESKLSDVQGQAGVLRYLGYNIDDLVENTTFEECVYLLHRQKLPTQAELDDLTATHLQLVADWGDYQLYELQDINP